MKTKVLVVIPSFSGGGAERNGIHFANHLSKNSSYSVHLLVFVPSGPLEPLVSERVYIHILNRRLRYSFIPAFAFCNFLDPDIVLSCIRSTNIIFAFLKPFFGFRLILREANTLDQIINFPFLLRAVYLFVMRLSYGFADRIIANSFDTQSNLSKFSIKSKENVVVGNPVLTPAFVDNVSVVNPYID